MDDVVLDDGQLAAKYKGASDKVFQLVGTTTLEVSSLQRIRSQPSWA